MQLSYLDRFPRREIIINLKNVTLKADLINNTLEVDGKCRAFDVDKNKPYRDMHRAIMTGALGYACSFRKGIEIVNLIECVEEASKDVKWVHR